MNTERLKTLLSHPMVAILALVVAPIGLFQWSSRQNEQHSAQLEQSEIPDSRNLAPASSSDKPHFRSDYVNVPAVEPSEFHSASIRGINPDEDVIGVVINGQPRAYVLEALRPLKECVVSDVVAGQPLYVICASGANQVRVATPRGPLVRKNGTKQEAPVSSPELKIIAALEGHLYLAGFGREFFFDATDVPLVDYPYSQCSWRIWRRAHPNTEVYVGSLELRDDQAPRFRRRG